MLPGAQVGHAPIFSLPTSMPYAVVAQSTPFAEVNNQRSRPSLSLRLSPPWQKHIPPVGKLVAELPRGFFAAPAGGGRTPEPTEKITSTIKVIKRMAYGFRDDECFFPKNSRRLSRKSVKNKKNGMPGRRRIPFKWPARYRLLALSTHWKINLSSGLRPGSDVGALR